MKPIPIEFHIGPLQVHTYGIGLAITFWLAYRYFGYRLRKHGYDTSWLARAFVWIIVASIVGARAVSVIANWGYYSRTPSEIIMVWHGGLSSYGGLALGVPVGFYFAHRWAKDLRPSVAADLVAPVLVVAWAVGRLLGPQLMYSGGGNRTNAWYGMYYAGEIGRRVPVPIFQAIECFAIFGIALLVERAVAKRGGPIGVVATAVVTLYGGSRYYDEHVLLAHGPGGVAVEGMSIAFVVAGLAFTIYLLRHDRGAPSGVPGDPWHAPSEAEPAAADELAEPPNTDDESSVPLPLKVDPETADKETQAQVKVHAGGDDTT